jgi:nitrate/TMAO reductase-like tetraheme cytochrome c subunit
LVRLPKTTHNWLSVAGATIAVISLFMIVFLFVVTVVIREGTPYAGIVIYVVLPAFLIFGLILIPIGMWITRRRMLKQTHQAQPAWPIVDLNKPEHRNAFLIFSLGSISLLLLSAVGTYKAYRYTESVAFCGQVCHVLMAPEYTARMDSPHAHVMCTQCHIGPGASWYVRSKLSGAKQVFATIFNTYPRPIPSPIKHLRPERIDCVQCHWPTEFHANRLRANHYFLADSANTEWYLELEMKIAGGDPAGGLKSGSHWHVNPDYRIDYAYTDQKAQDIVRVIVVDLKTRDTTVYVTQDTSISPRALDSLPSLTMDCISCHDRTAHRLKPPMRFVNARLADSSLSRRLPYIRSQAVSLFDKRYSTRDSGLQAIATHLVAYYQKNYPDIAANNKATLDTAVTVLQDEYRKNLFPDMKTSWESHPDNLGHLINDGCFRCHGANLVDKSGHTIPNDCSLCHEILAQGKPGEITVAPADSALTFQHPIDIEGAWQVMKCTTCHSGTGA